MKTQFLGAAVAVCISVAVANGQGQPVSYFVATATNGATLIPQVPTAGFVLTDIVWKGDASAGLWTMSLTETVNTSTTTQMTTMFGGTASYVITSLHLESGVPFTPDAVVNLASPNPAGAYDITLVGYIPSATTSGIIPAVSSWGMLTLAIGVAAAGTVALRRKRQVA